MLPTDRVAGPESACVHFASEGPSEDELTERGIALVRLHAERVSGKDDLIRNLAVGFSFPGYFGGNWDAVDECLRDLEDWLPAQGYVLVVSGAEELWRREPRFAGRLIESWLAAAEHWTGCGKPFHLVFEW